MDSEIGEGTREKTTLTGGALREGRFYGWRR